jgi:poly-gamma-glutamate synthesis protein (capsule biosynthesis protein)
VARLEGPCTALLDAHAGERTTPIVLFLCGDVMTGRGIDQVLLHPGDPVLYEPSVRDARDYVRLAERASGPIPRPMDGASLWGDALAALGQPGIDLRLVNLETSITADGEPWPGKGIHYRMHPQNIGSLTAARIDCCCLANNHALDWGEAGLRETLQTLDQAGIAHAGAGETAAQAAAPAVLPVAGKGRVLVCAGGTASSGIPRAWGATADRPGVHLLTDLSPETALHVARLLRAAKRPGDVAVVSMHWGGNWGYIVPDAHIAFAHRLIEEGVDLVHGHSAHHVQASEVYRGRLILYSCGDFVDDYEGIGGYEAFRPDLRVGHLVRIAPQDGRLAEVRLLPLQSRGFRLHRVAQPEALWLCDLLSRLGTPFGTSVHVEGDSSLALHWRSP